MEVQFRILMSIGALFISSPSIASPTLMDTAVFIITGEEAKPEKFSDPTTYNTNFMWQSLTIKPLPRETCSFVGEYTTKYQDGRTATSSRVYHFSKLDGNYEISQIEFPLPLVMDTIELRFSGNSAFCLDGKCQHDMILMSKDEALAGRKIKALGYLFQNFCERAPEKPF